MLIRRGQVLIASLLLIAPLTAFTQDHSPLAGTSWRLVQFEGGDGKIVKPPIPDHFTLDFSLDGSLAARIDCNRGKGAWKATPPAGLELKPMAVTRAFCGKDSMHDQILKHLPMVRSYVLKDGRLFLSLMADGGIYEFERSTALKSPLAATGQSSWRCEGASTTMATFYNTEPGLAVLKRDTDTRVAFRVVSASGAHYVGDDVSFWESRGEATINWSGVERRCQPAP